MEWDTFLIFCPPNESEMYVFVCYLLGPLNDLHLSEAFVLLSKKPLHELVDKHQGDLWHGQSRHLSDDVRQASRTLQHHTRRVFQHRIVDGLWINTSIKPNGRTFHCDLWSWWL